MNHRTAIQIRRYCAATGSRSRSIKRLWNATPRPERRALRLRLIEDASDGEFLKQLHGGSLPEGNTEIFTAKLAEGVGANSPEFEGIEPPAPPAPQSYGKTPRENAYVCQSCKHVTVTVDVSVGVTPFMIGCPACRHGDAHSSMYPKEPRPAHLPEPTHEWYSPDEREREKMRRFGDLNLSHVLAGGLLMRPRTSAEPVYHE